MALPAPSALSCKCGYLAFTFLLAYSGKMLMGTSFEWYLPIKPHTNNHDMERSANGVIVRRRCLNFQMDHIMSNPTIT